MQAKVSIEESVFGLEPPEPVVVRVRCQHWMETELILTASCVADVLPELREFTTARAVERWERSKPCECDAPS